MSNVDEIGSPNKLLRWVIILVVLIAIPSGLLSDWGLGKCQKLVNDNYEKPWAASLQKWIAHGYGYTLRPDPAAERYEWAARLYLAQGDSATAAELLYRQAEAFEAANKKYNAIPVYQQIAKDYPNLPVGAKAQGALVRLETMSRP